MQRSLWTSQRLNDGQPIQNMALVSHVGGPIDAERLARAFASVVAANDILRTTIRRGPDGDRVELFDVDPAVAWSDLTEITALPADRVDALVGERCRTPLDMTRRGFDSLLITHPDGTCSWYLNLHHVITDATSSALVFAATADAYFAEHEPADDMVAETTSYYRWVANEFSAGPEVSRSRQRAVRHWSGRPPAVELDRLYRPVDRPSSNREAGGAATRLPVEIDDRLLTRITERLDGDLKLLSPDLSWTVLLTTALAVYLHRVSGADRFAIGMPVHHRGRPETRALIGVTMEVFPVDIVIEPGDTFADLHARVGRAVVETMRHAVPGTSPSADVSAIVNIIPRAHQTRFGHYPAATRWIHPGAIDQSHLVRLQMTRYADGSADDDTANGTAGGAETFSFALDLAHRGADVDHRRHAVDHLLTGLRLLVTEPHSSIGSMALPTEAERDVLAEWGSGAPLAASEHADAPVIERLLASLDNRSDIALTDGERQISGRDLAGWIRRTASWLCEQGATTGSRVAVDLPRSAEAVVTIMASITAGCSFVPLDPSQPPERRARLIERAECSVIVSPADIAMVAELANGTRAGLNPVETEADDEAYLLFTSGSTGEPKGVPITHLGLNDYVAFATDAYVEPDRPPVAPLFSALTFDLTITTLFVPLLTGGRLIVVGDDGVTGLAAVAAETDITWAKTTPSHLEILMRLLPPEHRLHTVIVGGEAFGSALARQILAFDPEARIFNEYGPTEAVVGCMIHQVGPATVSDMAEVPIGRPAPGVTLVVVDQYLQPVPPGVAGELLIHHRGLTAGYLDADPDTDTTTPSPFVEANGRRFYRSGDLVRLHDPEQLVYLGRIDEQVKVGGRRLEPIEVEQALAEHPAIGRAAVRLWSPSTSEPTINCRRCGLPDNVPGVTFDEAGICDTCHAYEAVAPVAESWFKTPADLASELEKARSNRSGDHDVLHLLSGGKDSTYALYRLVEMGVRPYAITLDNGFISDGAKHNVRRSVADLGIDHEFVTTEAMNAIFADSLAVHSNVCNGCYKTIYTLATNRAAELGIPVIVTGLSRGQLFETRLIPQQFDVDRFDPDAIDRAVLEARKIYHRADDAANRLLDTDIFATDDVFSRISYIDFYRYVDVELSEMLDFLTSRAPWVRPADTGRSTNCLINAAGIHTHLTEQGYHNYAIPYAWDVRLGHKTRQEAIDELDDQLDLDEVSAMLAEVGYQPRRREVLTAWFEVDPGAGSDPVPDGAELRGFCSRRLPDYAIPAAFVPVDQIPLTTNGKVDTDALPAPQRVHRPSAGLHIPASTETERQIVKVWENVLGIEPIGVEDDFFALGGDSLGALESIVALAEALSVDAAEDLAFRHTTPRSLAAVLETLIGAEGQDSPATVADGGDTSRTPSSTPPAPSPVEVMPELSSGQQAILFDQAARPDDVMYNIGRVYHLDATAEVLRDQAALCGALERVAERHQPLSWTYGANRRRLSGAEALSFRAADPVHEAELADALASVHRDPFDLDNGPLLRCLVQPVHDGPTAVLLVVHHASADAESFDVIWREVNALLDGADLEPLSTDYGAYCRWQQTRRGDRDRRFWIEADVGRGNRPGFVVFEPEPDGFLQRSASVAPEALDRADGASAFAVALCAIGAALRPFTAEPEVEVGLITSTRTDVDADPLVGYFLNTVPMVVDRDPVAVARRLGETLSHRAFPLARIMADRREAGRPAAAPSIYVSFDDLSPGTVGSASAEQQVLSNGSAVADATIFVERRRDRLDLSLEYRGSVMTAAQAERLVTAIDRSLSNLTGSNGAPLPLVGSDQPSRLDGPPLPLAAARPLLGRIVELLDAAGASPAVVCGAGSLTWAELGRRSADLARHLVAQGVEPGDPVAITVGRSVDLIVAIVGVLRSGGAYVPIDPTYPKQRQELLLDRSGARLIVDAGVVERFARSEASTTQDRENLPPLPTVGPDDPAYLIFTSGSTGEPKPVWISHGRLTASTLARSPFYRVDATGAPIEGAGAVDDFRYLMLSSASFDSSVAGIFWTLAEGGTLLLPTDDEVHDVDAVADLLVDRAVSHTLMVPTLYQAVIDSMERRGLLRPVGDRQQWPGQVIVAGEACPPGLVEQHYRRFPLSRLTNEYGPTEATVWATGHHVRYGDDPVPIGVPIAGTWLEVRGPDGAVRPVEVAGELVLGGAGVAEQFGSTYGTGDRVAVVDGVVHYLGRVDNQLNIGGVRVEPEEIERTLTSVPGVRAAVVTVSAGLRLAAWVVADGDVEQEAALRDRVVDVLPPLWRPSVYRFRAELPRTGNGKIDREAVAQLEASVEVGGPAERTAEDEHAAATEPQRIMCRLFAEALGQTDFGLDDSFFDHGGHSLTAIELLLSIEDEFGRRVPVSALYRSQTPRGLVATIETTGRSADTASNNGLDDGAFLVPIQPNGTRPPVFAIHVLGIDCMYFRPLSARLGDDQPMYGLGQPTHDMDLNTEGPTSVAGIAAEYVTEINRVRPAGPIILAAISLGGVVAFETAQQLVAAGREVALLALFDATGPAAVQRRTELGFRGRLVTHLNALRDDPRDYVVGRTALQVKRLRRYTELAETGLRRRLGLDPNRRLDIRRFIEENIQSQVRYEYRPYPGDMAVYKAAGDPFIGHLLETDMGWRPVADGGLIIRVVGGDHLTMVAEPHVERLADLLQVDINDALATGGLGKTT